ncbi:MAG: alpha/beta fold hydrolase [Bacteroidota bacterium]
MTHGTFSDRKICMGIATWMAEHGYTSWILEWREHGASSKSPDPFHFEEIARLDLPLVFSYLKDTQKVNDVYALTHSGGGIILCLYLMIYPHAQESVKRIAVFGCQAFGAATSSWNYLKILGGKYLSKLIGITPGKMGGRPHDEHYHTMRQWFNWNISGQFLSETGEDFREMMPQMRVPVLSVYAKGDRFIAPPDGCIAFWQAFENPLNQGVYGAIENGFSEDFDHSRILHSQTALKEIWPRVLNWFSSIEGDLANSASQAVDD